jgi:hypothetical protein
MRHYEERELIGDEVTKNAIDSRGPLMLQVRKRALFRVNRRTCVHIPSPRMTGAGQHRAVEFGFGQGHIGVWTHPPGRP